MNRIPFFLFLLVLPIGTSFGQLWQQTNGVGGDQISSMAVNKQGHIFVVSRGLQRSTDGGVSWARLLPSTPIGSFAKIIIQPNGRLLIALSIAYAITDSILASDDNGNSWKTVLKKTYTLWQGADGDLFANDSNGYTRSTDNGASWKPLLLLGVGGSPQSFYSSGGNLFVCANFLYRSTDKGSSWSKIINGLGTQSFYVGDELLASPNGMLYCLHQAQLFRSSDFGRTWISIVNIQIQLSKLSIDVAGNILAIGGYGLMPVLAYSTDTAASWQYSFAPSIDRFSSDLGTCSTFEPPNSFLVSIRKNNFLRWKPGQDSARNISIPNGKIMSLIAHPEGTILSFNFIESEQPPHGGVWRSPDQGNTWSLSENSEFSIASTLDSSKNILRSIKGMVSRSTDVGKNWENNSPVLTTGFINGLAVRFNGHIFATSNSEGIFRSTDNGKTWDQLNSGITNQALSSLAIHQNGDIYAGGKNLIFKSTDNGFTWSTLNTNFPSSAGNVTAMVVNTRGDIIAGIENAGVFWSTDNGITWSEKAKGLTATRINALVSTPVGKVFAATNNGVFFLDTAAGANWVPFNFGITATNILSLCRDASGRLYAGTEASGVFRSNGTFNSISPGGPIAQLATSTVTFPGIEINTTTDTILNNVITNTGSDNLIILGADMTSVIGDGDFSLNSPAKFPVTIAPGASESIGITFKPSGYGERAALLRLYTNTPNGENDIAFDGIGMMKIGVKNETGNSRTSLGSAFPNPLSGSTTIPFSISETEFVHLDVTDALGRVVAVLADKAFESGAHEVSFNSNGLSAGMYYVRLRSGGKSEVKMILKTSEP